MAGGGSGEVMMRALADAHISFVAGALNIGDSDHALALRLAQEVITEQPYSPISPAILEQVRANLVQATFLIVCPMPIGPGNVALLQEALVAAQRDLNVLLLSPPLLADASSLDKPTTPTTPTTPATLATLATLESDMLIYTALEHRDYTGGEGLRLLQNLVQAGATIVHSVGEAIEIVRQQPLNVTR
jgi:iron complex transport system ATP-binding protein